MSHPIVLIALSLIINLIIFKQHFSSLEHVNPSVTPLNILKTGTFSDASTYKLL